MPSQKGNPYFLEEVELLLYIYEHDNLHSYLRNKRTLLCSLNERNITKLMMY